MVYFKTKTMWKSALRASCFLALVYSGTTPAKDLWDEEVLIPVGENRENIFELEEVKWLESLKQGWRAANQYPVEITGLVLPKITLRNRWVRWQVLDWLGLSWWTPGLSGSDDLRRSLPTTALVDSAEYLSFLGVSEVRSESGAVGVTFGCLACHSTQVFGRAVLGLGNKQSRANDFFHFGKSLSRAIPENAFRAAFAPNQAELDMYRNSVAHLGRVGVKRPLTLALDTSLAQVSLSLARRIPDEWATISSELERRPRARKLDRDRADSKPMTWWDLKYKNRWLSDGSLVSGNPIVTNFLWNEIGRGIDLHRLSAWMADNEKVLKDLTAVVFSSRPPQYREFFEFTEEDLGSAMRGERHYVRMCAGCHGIYEKAWSRAESQQLLRQGVFPEDTVRVLYHASTPVLDVGTDLSRAKGMSDFAEDLNRLTLSKATGSVIRPQLGYVPPPLEGVWLRYPYLHNASVPNLCALLEPAHKRPEEFVLGPQINPQTDFDQDCVGYPVGDKIPRDWILSSYEVVRPFDHPATSARGHDRWLVDSSGNERLSSIEKTELIDYLKTL